MQKTVNADQTPDRMKISGAIWIPFIYFAIQTTKGLGFWRDFFRGIEPTQVDAMKANLEGSPLDRLVLSVLILLALFVLRKRMDKIVRFARYNFPLVLLLVFMAMSIGWSDFRMVALKRWVRCFGTVTMVALIFT